MLEAARFREDHLSEAREGRLASLFGEFAKGYIKRRRSSSKGRRSVLDTSKGIYLGGTLLSILISLYLFTSGRRETGIFVGLWAPTVLNLGQTLLEDDKD
jgi:hypothetical protein